MSEVIEKAKKAKVAKEELVHQPTERKMRRFPLSPRRSALSRMRYWQKTRKISFAAKKKAFHLRCLTDLP